MIQLMEGGKGYIPADIGLAVLITAAALLSYGRVAFETGTLRMALPRLAIALGFTLLSLRFWFSLFTGNDPHIPPISMLSLGLITGGYCIVQARSISRAIQVSRVHVHCFRDPDLPCAREDRIQEAILQHNKGVK